MSVSDHDLETVEIWLDGELPVEQTDSLRRRISSEPALAAVVDRLRADRQLRSQVWQLTEPAENEVDTLVSNVRRGVARDELWTLRIRTLRNVTGVAASIVLVFMIGWIGRGRIKPAGDLAGSNNSQPAMLSSSQQVSSSGPLGGSQNNQLVEGIIEKGRVVAMPHATSGPPAYTVTVRDRYGRQYVRKLDDLKQLEEVPGEFIRALLQEPAPLTPLDPQN